MTNQSIKIGLDKESRKLLTDGLKIKDKIQLPELQNIKDRMPDFSDMKSKMPDVAEKIPKLEEKIDVEGLGAGFKDVTGGITALGGIMGFALGTGFGGVISALKDSSDYLSAILDIGGESFKLALMPMATFFAGFMKPILLGMLYTSLDMLQDLDKLLEEGEKAGNALTDFFTQGKVHEESALGILIKTWEEMGTKLGEFQLIPDAYADGIPINYGEIPTLGINYGDVPVIEFVDIGGIKIPLENITSTIADGFNMLGQKWIDKLAEVDPTVSVETIKQDVENWFGLISEEINHNDLVLEATNLINTLQSLGINVEMTADEIAALSFDKLSTLVTTLENSLIQVTDATKVDNPFLDGGAVTGGKDQLIDIIGRLSVALNHLGINVQFADSHLNSLSVEGLLNIIATLQNQLMTFSQAVSIAAKDVENPFLDAAAANPGGKAGLVDIVNRLSTALTLLGDKTEYTTEELNEMSFKELLEEIATLQNSLMGFSTVVDDTSTAVANNPTLNSEDKGHYNMQFGESDGTFTLAYFNDQFDDAREAMAAYESYLDSLNSTLNITTEHVIPKFAQGLTESEIAIREEFAARRELGQYFPEGKEWAGGAGVAADRAVDYRSPEARAGQKVARSLMGLYGENEYSEIEYAVRTALIQGVDLFKEDWEKYDLFNIFLNQERDTLSEYMTSWEQKQYKKIQSRFDKNNDWDIYFDNLSELLNPERLREILEAMGHSLEDIMSDLAADIAPHADVLQAYADDAGTLRDRFGNPIGEVDNSFADGLYQFINDSTETSETNKETADVMKTAAEKELDSSENYDNAVFDFGGYVDNSNVGMEKFTDNLDNIANKFASVANSFITTTNRMESAINKIPSTFTVVVGGGTRQNEQESTFNREG